MTVAKLLEQLKHFDLTMEVVIVHPSKGEPLEIGGVWVSEGSPDDDEPQVVELAVAE